MTEARRKTTARLIEKEIALDEPGEKIWRMLKDPEELAPWFPLKASVDPGKGGQISLSWGPQ
jgi:uncharacterized protein YndB with AHSA1/START domain